MAAPALPRQQMTIAKPANSLRPGGAIPVQSIQQKQKPAGLSNTSGRVPAPRLKVLVRRLPPALTEAEFKAVMGDDWLLGEKVDWASYIPGKLSRDPAKPSRPSRAYFRLTKQDYLVTLSEKVRETTFVDVKGSSNDSALLGLPSVEFAPYGRVPSIKPRKDGRQGTIDQDQEFINFLQELTNPITKPAPVDTSDKAKMDAEKTVTPLIQYLRDKKANKGKEVAAAKIAKHNRQDSKETKGSSAADKKGSAKGKDAGSDKKGVSIKVEKQVEKAAREAVKVLNKQVASKGHTPSAPAVAQASAASSSSPSSPSSSQKTVTPPAKPERKRERGSASAAAKILQRDLGLIGAPTGRRRRRDNSAPAVAAAPSTAPDAGAKSTSTSAAPSPVPTPAPSPPAVQSAPKPVQPPTGPAASRNQAKQAQSTSAPAAQQAKISPAPTPSPGATQAFLKHANPSQGITETLLSGAFTPFGPISKVEIDKKKGFAYVDFEAPQGLQKAMAASPVKVAQGQVVVLERKTGAVLQNRNTKGGGSAPVRGGAGGGSQGGQRVGAAAGGQGGRVRGRGGKAGGEVAGGKGGGTAPVAAATAAATTTSAQAATNGPAAAAPAVRPTAVP